MVVQWVLVRVANTSLGFGFLCCCACKGTVSLDFPLVAMELDDHELAIVPAEDVSAPSHDKFGTFEDEENGCKNQYHQH